VSDEEELLAAGRAPAQRRRLRVDIAVAIVVLGGGYLIARGWSHGHSTHEITPAPTSTASGTVSLTGPPPRGVFTFGAQGAPGPDQLASVAPCPGTCANGHHASPAVVAALHHVFARLVVDAVDTEVPRSRGIGNGGAIWSEMLTCHDRNTFLILVVSRHGPSGSAANQLEVNGQTTFYLRLQRAPYTVQMEIVETSRSGPGLGTVTELANDPRLVPQG
jgi:hypothetical protein